MASRAGLSFGSQSAMIDRPTESGATPILRNVSTDAREGSGVSANSCLWRVRRGFLGHVELRLLLIRPDLAVSASTPEKAPSKSLAELRNFLPSGIGRHFRGARDFGLLGGPSARILRRYVWRIADLPCSWRGVCLRIITGRFFCDTGPCRRLDSTPPRDQHSRSLAEETS